MLVGRLLMHVLRYADKLPENAPELAWTAPVRSGDPVCRDAPRQSGARVRPVMQLGRPLMVFVMGSVVVTSGHQNFSICPDLLWAFFASS